VKLQLEQLDIPAEKILQYLLAKKEKNDKSNFLMFLGYSKVNWQDLSYDIKNIALNNNLVLKRTSEFGNLYSIRGKLKNKFVITIWLKQSPKIRKLQFSYEYQREDSYKPAKHSYNKQNACSEDTLSLTHNCRFIICGNLFSP